MVDSINKLTVQYNSITDKYWEVKNTLIDIEENWREENRDYLFSTYSIEDDNDYCRVCDYYENDLFIYEEELSDIKSQIIKILEDSLEINEEYNYLMYQF